MLLFARAPRRLHEVLGRFVSKWYMALLGLRNVPLKAIYAIEPVPRLFCIPWVAALSILQPKSIRCRIMFKYVRGFFSKELWAEP